MASLPEDTNPADSKTDEKTATATSSPSPKFNAVVIGGSGSVGQEVIKSLLKSDKWQTIHLINRKNIELFSKENKIIQTEMDMKDLETFKQTIKSTFSPKKNEKEEKKAANDETESKQPNQFDAAFVALGCGAPSKVDHDTLYRVDVEIPTAFCESILECGIGMKHCSLLTSVGSNINKKKDWLGTAAGGGWYLHCKGAIENNIASMNGFNTVGIFRPSTLFGSKNTPGIAEVLTPLVSWALPKKYEGIHIRDLGGAMVKHAEKSLVKGNDSGNDSNEPKVDILQGHDLFDLVKEL